MREAAQGDIIDPLETAEKFKNALDSLTTENELLRQQVAVLIVAEKQKAKINKSWCQYLILSENLMILRLQDSVKLSESMRLERWRQ